MNFPLFLKRAAKIRTFSLPANFSAIFFENITNNTDCPKKNVARAGSEGMISGIFTIFAGHHKKLSTDYL